jgi:hypothetical protein
MDTLKFSGRTRVAGLIAVSLVTLLLLSSCAAQPSVNVEATAQSLARAWVAQTAEAQSAAKAAPTATDTPVSAVSTPPATEIPAPASTATSTLMPAPTVMPTRPPATTVTASPEPGLTPGPATACAVAVDPKLAAGWDQMKLGCPIAKAAVIWAAWEPFQHGEMLWRSDLDWTYALHRQNGTDVSLGDWSTGKDTWKWDQSFPDGHGLTPPPGLLEPVRGFGYAWYNFLGGSTSPVGWATSQEKGFCANLQPFEKGIIVHSSNTGSCQDGQYNWAANPAFAPLFFTLYEDGTWVRHPSK